MKTLCLLLCAVVSAGVAHAQDAPCLNVALVVPGNCVQDCETEYFAPPDVAVRAATATCGYQTEHAVNASRDCSPKWSTELYPAPLCGADDFELTAQGVWDYREQGFTVAPRLCGPGRLLTEFRAWTETCRTPGFIYPGQYLVNYYKVRTHYSLYDDGPCCIGGPVCGCS